jgi:Phosphate-selective porin O and P
MKKGIVSLMALSLVCVGFAFEGSGEPVTPLVLQGQKNTDKTNFGWFSGYVQQQYFSTDQATKNGGFFRNRRTRLSYNYMGDEKTMAKLSVEFASGTNHTSAQVRETFVQYKPNSFKAKSGPTFTAGAQHVPIGYENLYSSSAVMWSERSVYQSTFFNSEVSKGLLFQNGDEGTYWFVGLFDSLTVGDPEQSDSTTKGEVMPVYGVHGKMGNFEGGLSAMSGNRPAYSAGAISLAQTDRTFMYADLRYHPAGSKLDVRSEYMIGKDRVPLAAVAAANKVAGGHVNVDYKFNATDTAILRYETFDRNTSLAGKKQTLYGVGLAKDVNSFMRVSAWADWNKNPTNPAGQTSYKTLTFRVQFKF